MRLDFIVYPGSRKQARKSCGSICEPCKTHGREVFIIVKRKLSNKVEGDDRSPV